MSIKDMSISRREALRRGLFGTAGLLLADGLNGPAIAAPPPAPLPAYELPSFSKTTADIEPHFIKLKLSLGYEMSPELNSELIKRKSEMQHILMNSVEG